MTIFWLDEEAGAACAGAPDCTAAVQTPKTATTRADNPEFDLNFIFPFTRMPLSPLFARAIPVCWANLTKKRDDVMIADPGRQGAKFFPGGSKEGT